jgi:hypothetical protein
VRSGLIALAWIIHAGGGSGPRRRLENAKAREFIDRRDDSLGRDSNNEYATADGRVSASS